MAKTKLKKTISQVGYAPLTVNESTGAYTYSSVIWFVHNEAGGREYSASANGEMTEIYADGVSVYSAEENHGYDIDLTLLRVTDDIDEDWLGNEVDDEGNVTEFANNMEKPAFALVIIEDTTDGVGLTHIWYNCRIAERPGVAGQTSEDSGFDPQFFEANIQARPRMSDRAVYQRRNAKELFTTIPEPSGTSLAIVNITNASISPEFDPLVTAYTLTAASGQTTGRITVAAYNPGATVAITQGGETVENGGVVTFASGAITVVVTNGESSKTYTITPGT